MTPPPNRDSGFVAATAPQVAVMGRAVRTEADELQFGYPGVTLRVAFTGASVGLRARSTTGNSRLAVVVDGAPARVVRVPTEPTELGLASGVSAGPHLVEVVHRTETWQGVVTVSGFVLGPGGTLGTPPAWPARKLLFIGDSVTSGEGADRAAAVEGDVAASSDATRSFGMRLAAALDAQCHLVSYGGRGVLRDWQGRRDVLNAPAFELLALPVEGEAPRWRPEDYQPDGIVVSLGTNDFNLDLGPLPDAAELVGTYVAFVRALRSRYPGAKLLLTEGAIVNDAADPQRPQKTVLRRTLAQVAAVVGDPAVRVTGSEHYPGDANNAHPTGEQHARMARELEAPLRELLGW